MSLFDRFVDPDNPVRGFISYGLYKAAKREWVAEFEARSKTQPTTADVAAYTATWTRSMITGKRNEASQVLEKFAEEIVAVERPAIVEAALRGSFARTVGINILSAFLYTLILIGLVVVLRYAGIDLLALAGTVR